MIVSAITQGFLTMPGPGLRPVAADATPDRFVAGGVATPAIQDPRVFKSIPSESDVALLEKLERKGYQPCESPENPLEVADFLARVGQGPLLLEHSDGNVEINSLGDLQPLHYFFGDSDVAPDADAAAFRALEKEGFDFKTDEGALDTYHAWRLFQDKADTTLLLKGDYRRGEHSVRGMDGVRLAGYVLADGPVPARADRAESLKRLQAEHCKVQDLQAAYEGAAPIPIIHDDVELVVLQPAALDRPDALLHDVKKQRDTFKAIKDAVRYGQSEEAWRCARTDIPGVSFDDRVEAVKLLGKAAKYNDHVENLFTLVKERRPSGVAFVDAARDLAGFVERVGADEGGKAWIRLHEDILPHRPRDLDDAATRAAFDALLEAGGSAEVAGRMWDALLDAKVPEPLVERFGAVKTLHDELRLDGDDCEEALKAVLELRRPSETLVGAVADLCAVARIVDERGELVDAFRTLRGPLSGPDDVPHEQRQTRLRALLDGTGKMSEATQAYEVVAQARDAAAFARRADAMEAVVKVTKSREWRGREAVEVFKAIETYGGWDGATAAALVRLLPLGGTVEAAVNLREALLRTVSEKGYDAAERALQAIAAVGPQDRDRGERALSDYRFLFRRHGADGAAVAAARFAELVGVTGNSGEARRAYEDLAQTKDEARYVRFLRAGGHASTADAATRMDPQVDGWLERLVATLKPLEDGHRESILLARELLRLGCGADQADLVGRMAAKKEPESILEPLRLEVLAPSRDRADAITRLNDFSSLLEATSRPARALDAWRALQAETGPERCRALLALLRANQDVDDAISLLQSLERRMQPGDSLAEHAEVLAALAKHSRKADSLYGELRDWAAETGDAAVSRLKRYAEIGDESTLRKVMDFLTVPVGAEDFASREKLYWALSEDGAKNVPEDYAFVTSGLHPRTTLDEAGRAWKTLRIATLDRRERTRLAFEKLSARLWDHPDESLEGLAAWLAMNMTVSDDLERVIARLDAQHGNQKVEQGGDEVVIGKIRVPVKRKDPAGRGQAFALAMNEYLKSCAADEAWQVAR